MMELSQKNILRAFTVFAFAAILAVNAKPAGSAGGNNRQSVEETENRQGETFATAGELVFWYEGSEYESFFQRCAEDYRDRTGVRVLIEQRESLDYFKGIYKASIAGEEYPDAYLLDAQQLEQAYLCQLAAENTQGLEESTADNGKKACTYGEKLCGYPLCFTTYVFAYQNGYFETPPSSIQEILEFAVNHDPGEGVEKLMEWDIADAFYNFAFTGGNLAFDWEEPGKLSVVKNEEGYEDCLSYFGTLPSSVALDPETMEEEQVVKDFREGKTVAALLSTDELYGLKDYDCQITLLPRLKDEVPLVSAAQTQIMLANAFSKNQEEADKFCRFVAEEESALLEEETGQLSVDKDAVKGERELTAMSQYEASTLLPSALDAQKFWVEFQNRMLEIWEKAELSE